MTRMPENQIISQIYGYIAASLFDQPELVPELTTEALLQMQPRPSIDTTPETMKLVNDLIASTYPITIELPQQLNPEDLAIPETTNTEEAVVSAADVEAVSTQFGKLNRLQRQVLWLRINQRLTPTETAEVLGITELEVQAWFSTGIDSLSASFVTPVNPEINRRDQVFAAIQKFSHAPQFIPDQRFKAKMKNLLATQNAGSESKPSSEEADRKDATPAAISFGSFTLPPVVSKVMRHRLFYPIILILILLLTVAVFIFAGWQIFGPRAQTETEVLEPTAAEPEEIVIDTSAWTATDLDNLGMLIDLPPTASADLAGQNYMYPNGNTDLAEVRVNGFEVPGLFTVAQAAPNRAFTAGFSEVSNDEFTSLVVDGKLRIFSAYTDKPNSTLNKCGNDIFTKVYTTDIGNGFYVYIPITYTVKCEDGKVINTQVPDAESTAIARAALNTLQLIGQPEPTKGWNQYSHPEYGMAFKFPTEFTEESWQNLSHTVGSITINPVEVAAGSTLEQACNAHKQAAAGMHGNDSYVEMNSSRNLCIVYASAGAPVTSLGSISAVVVKLPSPAFLNAKEYQFFSIAVFNDYLLGLQSSVQLSEPTSKNPITADPNKPGWKRYKGTDYTISFPQDWSATVASYTASFNRLTLRSPDGTSFEVGIDGDHSVNLSGYEYFIDSRHFPVVGINRTMELVWLGTCDPNPCEEIDQMPNEIVGAAGVLVPPDPSKNIAGSNKNYSFAVGGANTDSSPIWEITFETDWEMILEIMDTFQNYAS